MSQDACIGHDNRLYQLVKKQCVGFEVKTLWCYHLMVEESRMLKVTLSQVKGTIAVPWFPMMSERDNNIAGRDA